MPDSINTDFIERAQALLPLVRQHADFADAQRHLHPEVAAAFAAAGLYRLAAPELIHGADATALTQVAVLETVSAADASSGWNLMIGMETFGLIGPSMGECADLLADPLRVMASSTAAVGRAERDGDNWRVSGHWQFASGVHNASLFGATVHLYDGEQRLSKAPCYALIEATDFTIVDTWHTVGMRGSGSHDVVIDGALVPQRQIVASIADASSASLNLKYPRGPRLAYNKAAVALGIARAGLDAFTDLARGKRPRFASSSLRERPLAQRTIALAEARYLGLRTATHTVVDELWQTVAAGKRASGFELARFQAVCSDVAQTTAELVNSLALAAGTSANDVNEPIARILRDALVVRQHVTVAPHQIDDAGRLLLGLEPVEAMLRGAKPDRPA